MKRIVKYLTVTIALLLALTLNVKAASASIYVDLETLKYSTDKSSYSAIKEYETLEDFLVDYNAGTLPSIYITNFLFDGVSTVKSPDLDDFIENDSNDTKIKTITEMIFNAFLSKYDPSYASTGICEKELESLIKHLVR